MKMHRPDFPLPCKLTRYSKFSQAASATLPLLLPIWLSPGICFGTVEEYTTRCTVDELHSSMSGGTSGSLLSAGIMGIDGNCGESYSALPQESELLSYCAANTGDEYASWPDQCAPPGMQAALNDYSEGQRWLEKLYAEGEVATAIYDSLSTLKKNRSPLVLPIYGVAGHFATVYWMRLTDDANNPNVNESCSDIKEAYGDAAMCLEAVKFYDAQKLGATDGYWHSTLSGPVTTNGLTWQEVYYKAIYTLDESDPYYRTYLFLYDPPVFRELWAYYQDETVSSVRQVPLALVGSPGVLNPGETMSIEIAQERVLESLELARLRGDRDVAAAITGARAGQPMRVDATTPSGAPWSYYLVPMYTSAQEISSLVMLSAEDGAFQMIQTSPIPARFTPMSRDGALELARKHLHRGWQLQGGELEWHPADSVLSESISSPLRPYFRFDVKDERARARGRILVALDSDIRYVP